MNNGLNSFLPGRMPGSAGGGSGGLLRRVYLVGAGVFVPLSDKSKCVVWVQGGGASGQTANPLAGASAYGGSGGGAGALVVATVIVPISGIPYSVGAGGASGVGTAATSSVGVGSKSQFGNIIAQGGGAFVLQSSSGAVGTYGAVVGGGALGSLGPAYYGAGYVGLPAGCLPGIPGGGGGGGGYNLSAGGPGAAVGFMFSTPGYQVGQSLGGTNPGANPGGGGGGDSYFGPGGNGGNGSATVGSNGLSPAATSYGAGGGGGGNGPTAGAGAAGMAGTIIVEEYGPGV